ncbi:hypothetical protein JCM10450v2_000767 [Rhodotorula kratochvilovae]
MTATYSEPSYIFAEPAATALSDTRPTRLAPTALVALNHLIDELLHLVVHAALHSTPSSTAPTSSPTGGASSLPPKPLAPSEVLTTERFKSALARILGPTSLAKECILEAELAVRELVRRGSPSLRGDGALKRAHGMWGSPILPSLSSARGDDTDKAELASQAAEVFGALRAWAMQISALGAACPSGGSVAPPPLQEHLVALMPPRPAPSHARSEHLTFVLALYVERVLTTLAAHLLRLVSGVAARSATAEVAGVADVETALMEDTLVWSWLQGMRVRALLEDEAARERERAKRGSPVLAQSALPRRSYSSAGGMATTGAPPVALPSSAGLARKASLSGSTAVPSTNGARRPSMDSVMSGSTAAGIAYPRKCSSAHGLGILSSGASANSAPPPDDAFDQLLNSGRTLKLSSTPDRLRNFENRANRLSASSSLPTIASSNSSIASKDSSSRRLRARDPQPRHLFAEEDEDAAAEAERARKDSLMDLLHAGPPGSGTGSGSSAGAGAGSRRASLVPRRPVPPDDPSHPMSAAMRVQDSQGSVRTVDSALSDDSFASGSPRARALKAKDEKRDLASERQINHDLVDFFSNAPPPPPSRSGGFSSAYADDLPPVRAPASPKKSKGGLRGLVSMVTGSSRAEKEAEARASVDAAVAPTPPPQQQQKQQQQQQRTGAASPPRVQKTTRSRSLSQQGIAAAAPLGASAAAYAPPPGLGSPKSSGGWEREGAAAAEARQERRAKSVATQGSAPMYEEAPPLPIAGAVPSAIPRGMTALTNGHGSGSGSTSASSSDLSHGGLPPPIPPVPAEETSAVKPPRRSSSLKRSTREREHSTATATRLAPSSLYAVPTGGRTRETSAASMLSRGTAASARQFVEVESAAAPVTVVPSGAFAGDALSTPPSADEHDLPPVQLPAVVPAAPAIDDQVTLGAAETVAAAAALAPAVAAAAAHPLDGEAAAAAAGPASGLANGFLKATPLSPVEEVPTPGLAAPEPFAAPPPPAAKSQRSTTPLSTPPMPSSSPAPPSHGPLTTATLPGARSVVALLKDLRGAMLLAQTRDECLDLVEGMLRDQAWRVEALAQREREAAAEEKEEEDGVERRDWAQEERVTEGMQARMAEVLLGPASRGGTPVENGREGEEVV